MFEINYHQIAGSHKGMVTNDIRGDDNPADEQSVPMTSEAREEPKNDKNEVSHSPRRPNSRSRFRGWCIASVILGNRFLGDGSWDLTDIIHLITDMSFACWRQQVGRSPSGLPDPDMRWRWRCKTLTISRQWDEYAYLVRPTQKDCWPFTAAFHLSPQKLVACRQPCIGPANLLARVC